MKKYRNFIRNLWTNKKKARLIERGTKRDLYKTYFGDLYWLSQQPDAYLDQCIKKTSIFEPLSTNIIKRYIKPGQIVLDVGANIGYYTVIMSKAVGKCGKVICFEPTDHYRKVLYNNIDINELNNVKILKYGLSNKRQNLNIDIGNCSATLHNPSDFGNDLNQKTQRIVLHKLDSIFDSLNIDRVDFIKVDIDGHEHAFIEGAKKVIEEYNPIILLEVNHLNYLQYGITAWDFYDYLISNGFKIYSEKSLKSYETKTDYLIDCGNFAFSANILISKTKLK